MASAAVSTGIKPMPRILHHAPRAAQRRRTCSISSPMSSAIRNSCRCAARCGFESRIRKPEGVEIIVADMTVAYKLLRETFTSRVTLDRPNLQILVEYLRGPVQQAWRTAGNSTPSASSVCDVKFFIDLRVPQPHARHADGCDVRRRVPAIRGRVRATRGRDLRAQDGANDA